MPKSWVRLSISLLKLIKTEKIKQTFIPTEIEFVEFARCIFNSYRENIKSKQLDFVFDTNRENIYTVWISLKWNPS